ncbi:hypothetical protein [Pseudomonas sp. BE134]|uniref:hypothetical protein n=1 Tax=Pseudomonas sp. BE134 TaxID=2817843 RepID=UPI00286495BC|nr:hypothetical protein [Pseudomonas sp. BE134]MDR6929547.1 integrase [Pseudomonas sp. BE134]
MSIPLYRTLTNVVLPTNSDISPTHSPKTKTKDNKCFKTIPALTLMVWPNGKPCTLINLWLMEKQAYATGNSCATLASQLTHFLRFCHSESLTFDDLSDRLISKWINKLEKESKQYHTNESTDTLTESSRASNQIHHIGSRAIEFLTWYQESFRNHKTNLIGVIGSGAPITVKKKFNKLTGKYNHSHASIPKLGATTGDKHAMPESYISLIEDEIFKKLELSLISTHSRFNKNDTCPILKATRLYLYSRRVFLNWILDRTGCRPSEVVDMSLAKNSNTAKTLKLLIPTKKKRSKIAPTRSFPISLIDSIDFNQYLDARKAYVAALIDGKVITCDPGTMMIGEKGKPIKTASLLADFRRLAHSAGLSEVKICASMYRHRFITRQIMFAMEKYRANKVSVRDLWSPIYQIKICEDIIKLTGHASVNSLTPYYDETYKAFSKAFDTANDDYNFVEVDSTRYRIGALAYQARLEGNSQFPMALKEFQNTWQQKLDMKLYNTNK